CSASASSLLGVFLTPVLVGIVVSTGQLADVQISFDAVGNIMVQLLLPFVAGHLARPWIGSWVMKRNKTLKNVDQGSILLVVYTAFSKAIVAGLWATTPLWALVSLAAVCAGLLAIVLALAVLVGRATGF